MRRVHIRHAQRRRGRAPSRARIDGQTAPALEGQIAATFGQVRQECRVRHVAACPTCRAPGFACCSCSIARCDARGGQTRDRRTVRRNPRHDGEDRVPGLLRRSPPRRSGDWPRFADRCDMSNRPCWIALTTRIPRVRRIAGLNVRAGRAYPFGATLVPGGVNFSIFSRHATSCTLVLFQKGEPRAVGRASVPRGVSYRRRVLR